MRGNLKQRLIPFFVTFFFLNLNPFCRQVVVSRSGGVDPELKSRTVVVVSRRPIGEQAQGI